MRKFFYLLLAFTLVISACTQTPTPQRKDLPEDDKKIVLESKESSIFAKGTIEKVRVIKSSSFVRAGFSEKYPVVAQLTKGDVLNVVGEFNDWFAVQLDNNYVGAVAAGDVTPVIVEETQPNNPQNDFPKNDNYLKPPVAKDEKDIEGEPDIDDEPNIDETPKGIIPGSEDKLSEEDLDVGDDNNTNNSQLPSGDFAGMEEEMLALINSERAKNSLSPLVMDSQVRQVARMKSQDMVDNDYFSHYSPTYGSPFDMMDEFGIKYVAAGENIAGNSTVEKAHTALMNSAGHRKNILNSQFTHIGIGIKKSDKYGYVFTQMFISKPQ